MADFHLNVEPRDAVISRDGRPFGAAPGGRMKGLDWLFPSVLAGSLRTLLGKQAGGNFDEAMVTDLKAVEVAGPLMAVGHELYLPAPKDFILRELPDRAGFAARPVAGLGAACDLPEGLEPVLLPEAAGDDFKPGKAPAFWSVTQMGSWLASATGEGFATPLEKKPVGFSAAPEKEDRYHSAIEAVSGTAEEGKLFKTVGLAFAQGTAMAARVRCAEQSRLKGSLQNLNVLHPLGGERRLASFQSGSAVHWGCPDSVRGKLQGAKLVRMVLATPAIFEHGWKPGWLDENWLGSPPGSELSLRLVGAAVERWRPVSGWSLERGKAGAKAVRRVVPAGSVYFFEVEGAADGRTLAERWLEAVSDDPQDQRDGFGLAVWGVWQRH